MLPILTANLQTDLSRAVVRQIEPGDPEFRNPLAAADYSYVVATEDQLGHLEFVKPKS